MTGVEMIAEERERQVREKGWTAGHDDMHDDEELAMAAAVYACPKSIRESERLDDYWPWPDYPASGKTRLRELAKAGALIAAEIDRLVREGARRRAAR